MIAVALSGCSRDNPLFGDGGTDDVDGTTTRTTGSASASASTSTQPTSEASSSDPDTSESVSETQSVLTSDSFGTTFGTTGSGSGATSGSESGTCTSVLYTPTLEGDAFLVETDDCPECANANYGATAEHELFEQVSGVAYYVAKLEKLPVGAHVLEGTLTLTVERQINGNAALEVHAFWPGCDWPEGTGDGPKTPTDGITYNACDAETGVEYTMGSLPASIGELLAPAIAIDDEIGLMELEIELDAVAVQDWLDAGGDQLLFSAPVEAGVLRAAAREAEGGGGLQLEIATCG